jgi:hypothetical protein
LGGADGKEDGVSVAQQGEVSTEASKRAAEEDVLTYRRKSRKSSVAAVPKAEKARQTRDRSFVGGCTDE